MSPLHIASTSGKTAAQHSVHPTGGSLRVFKQFLWLEVSSAKVALSRPTHQPVTQAVSPCYAKRDTDEIKIKRFEKKGIR